MKTQSTIARLDEKTQEWTKLGDLNTGRSGHGVIFDGQHFLVVGGEGNGSFENRNLMSERNSDNIFKCI